MKQCESHQIKAGSRVDSIIRRMGQRLALVVMLLATASNAQAQAVRYIHTDGLGSVVVVTDEQRNILERREYEPYGATLAAVKDGPGFTGHVSDAQTGLNYMQQRYYDPQVGRFLSIDPVAVRPVGDNFNRYWYGNNNPYRFTDPDGRESVQEMIDSGADGCGVYSCAGYAMLSASWQVLGAEGVSQWWDRGGKASGGNKASAGIEVLSVLPPVRILRGATVATKATKAGSVATRGAWTITREGTERVVQHDGFGKIYKGASDGLWWAKDNAGHGGSAWKVFKENSKGLEWYRDADEFGDFIVGKHKGDVGRFIPWKQLRGSEF